MELRRVVLSVYTLLFVTELKCQVRERGNNLRQEFSIFENLEENKSQYFL